MSAESLVLFMAAGVLLNLTPGPDVLVIVSNALRHGRRAGVMAALGVFGGCFVHIVAATVGVSALLAASATAFAVLKWLGAAYLLVTGLRLLTARAPGAIKFVAGAAESTGAGSQNGKADCAGKGGAREAGGGHGAERLAVLAASDQPDYRAIFVRGFGTNALNPKVALFFLAFLPQFIGPDVANKQLAFLLLGLLFNLNSLLVCLGWALAAARLQQGLRNARRNWLGALDRIAGAMFVAFAVKLALTPAPTA